MTERKFDELISYFNRKVSDMDIDRHYKMELLGMVTALGYAHEKETEERKTGRWITHKIKLNGVYNSYCECTACGHTRPTTLFPLYYCPNCGAKMEEEPNG